VGAEYSSQGWNRYSYVGNNPLRYTDPSGLCGFFCFISHIFNPVQHFEDVFAITRAVYSVPYLGEAINIATIAASAVACQECAIGVAAGTAALQAGVTSGKLGVALEAGAIAGAEAAAFDEVGDITGHNPSYLTANGDLNPSFVENVAGHALVGCAAAAASGSDCGSGALSAGFGAAAAPAVTQIGQLNYTEGLIAESVAGGIGSVAGGGKFQNGAITGAFGYLFNTCGAAPNPGQCTAKDEALGHPISPFDFIAGRVGGGVKGPRELALRRCN